MFSFSFGKLIKIGFLIHSLYLYKNIIHPKTVWAKGFPCDILQGSFNNNPDLMDLHVWSCTLTPCTCFLRSEKFTLKGRYILL
jgi:hypothetical protein